MIFSTSICKGSKVNEKLRVFCFVHLASLTLNDLGWHLTSERQLKCIRDCLMILTWKKYYNIKLYTLNVGYKSYLVQSKFTQ